MHFTETKRLTWALRRSAVRANSGRETIADFVRRLGPSSDALLCLFLTLPFIQPVSTGPLAVVGGLVFAAMGWRMARGEREVWLPAKVQNTAPGPKTWRSLAKFGVWFLTLSHRLTRNGRMSMLHGLTTTRTTGWFVALGGLLMAVPFIGVPLNNTFPALMIFFACLARLERDGVMVILSVFFKVVTLGYFALIIWGMTWLGGESFEWLKGFFNELGASVEMNDDATSVEPA